MRDQAVIVVELCCKKRLYRGNNRICPCHMVAVDAYSMTRNSNFHSKSKLTMHYDCSRAHSTRAIPTFITNRILLKFLPSALVRISETCNSTTYVVYSPSHPQIQLHLTVVLSIKLQAISFSIAIIFIFIELFFRLDIYVFNGE